MDECHIDGLRVDAVASMLYLATVAPRGVDSEPVRGRENIAALEFLRQLNDTVHARHPGVMMIAEESTRGRASPSALRRRPRFQLQVEHGWMHDTLLYFRRRRSTASITTTI